MSKEQTAVEWLEEQIEKHSWYDSDGFRQVSVSILDFNQAKELEKQQIIDAFWNGDNTDCLSEQNSKEFAEQYYNDKYN